MAQWSDIPVIAAAGHSTKGRMWAYYRRQSHDGHGHGDRDGHRICQEKGVNDGQEFEYQAGTLDAGHAQERICPALCRPAG